jgi:hypothetical protein
MEPIKWWLLHLYDGNIFTPKLMRDTEPRVIAWIAAYKEDENCDVNLLIDLGHTLYEDMRVANLADPNMDGFTALGELRLDAIEAA